MNSIDILKSALFGLIISELMIINGFAGWDISRQIAEISSVLGFLFAAIYVVVILIAVFFEAILYIITDLTAPTNNASIKNEDSCLIGEQP
jgi:hypothetical protein